MMSDFRGVGGVKQNRTKWDMGHPIIQKFLIFATFLSIEVKESVCEKKYVLSFALKAFF